MSTTFGQHLAYHLLTSAKTIPPCRSMHAVSFAVVCCFGAWVGTRNLPFTVAYGVIEERFALFVVNPEPDEWCNSWCGKYLSQYSDTNPYTFDAIKQIHRLKYCSTIVLCEGKSPKCRLLGEVSEQVAASNRTAIHTWNLSVDRFGERIWGPPLLYPHAPNQLAMVLCHVHPSLLRST